MKKIFTLSLSFLAAMTINAQEATVVTFEGATLAEDGTLKGTSYEENGFVFENYYSNEGWEYNSGYTVSDNTDRNTPGSGNQYSVDARGGADGSKQFVVYNPCYYADCHIRRADNADFAPSEVALALTTYTSLSIQDGDAYAKKFEEGDFYTMTVQGLDAEGNVLKSIDIKIVEYPRMWMPWAKADLSELGTVNKLMISFSSSDNSYGYMNTPGYIALDNFKAVVAEASDVATFEDLQLDAESHWAGDADGEEAIYGMASLNKIQSGGYSFDNYYFEDYDSWFGYGYSNHTSTEYNVLDDQYNSCVGSGNNGSANYLVAYPDGAMWGVDPCINVEGEAKVVPGFYITNTAWVVKTIVEGDAMAGEPFKAGDFFKITIHAVGADGEETMQRDYYLADYRSENEADHHYVKDWQYVDLSKLGEAKAFYFTFDGTRKSGKWMNTPTYFCIDDFGAEGVENSPATAIASIAKQADSETTNAYNLNGTSANGKLRPGVYVMNGRKVVVK